MPTLSKLITITDGAEVIPRLLKDNYLYFTRNYGGNPNSQGAILKADLSQSPPSITSIYVGNKLASWQGVYVNKLNKIIEVGEEQDSSGILRSVVHIIDLSNDTVKAILHPNTGDCNEFIGIVYDDKNNRLIVGERKGGGDTNGSSYPNGGGLWSIPLDTISDTNTWSRLLEFSPLPNDSINPEIGLIHIYDNELYIVLTGSNSSVIKKAPINSISDINSYVDVESMDIITSLDVHGKRIAYISVDQNSGNTIIKYSDDGTTWNTIDLGITPSSLSDLTPPVLYIMIIGKYFLVLGANNNGGRVLLVSDSGTVYDLGSLANPYFPHVIGHWGKDKVYIGNTTSSSTSSTSYIYELSFDVSRILTISLDNSNVSPNSIITLRAKLLENGTPVVGETIDFFVIHSKVQNRGYGTYIGSATTDSNGEASIQYQVPNITGKIVFRALYKG